MAHKVIYIIQTDDGCLLLVNELIAESVNLEKVTMKNMWKETGENDKFYVTLNDVKGKTVMVFAYVFYPKLMKCIKNCEKRCINDFYYKYVVFCE